MKFYTQIYISHSTVSPVQDAPVSDEVSGQIESICILIRQHLKDKQIDLEDGKIYIDYQKGNETVIGFVDIPEEYQKPLLALISEKTSKIK